MQRVILGLDPASFKNMGFCIAGLKKEDEFEILERGTIVFSVDKNTKDERFIELKETLEKYIENYKVTDIAFERTQFGKRFVMAQIYETIGVIKLLAQINKISLFEISPMTAKKVITGSGKSGKNIMKQEVKKIFNISNKDLSSDHEADAIAMAYACSKVE